jgi:hypothetical protein
MHTLATILAAEGYGSIFDPLKQLVNAVTQPAPFMLISIAVFALMFLLYKWWT